MSEILLEILRSGGVRNFWRGVREKVHEPPLVTGLLSPRVFMLFLIIFILLLFLPRMPGNLSF